MNFHSTRSKRWRTRFSWALVVVGACALLVNWVKYGQGSADQISSGLSLLITLFGGLGLIPTLRKDSDPPVSEILPALRDDVREVWTPERQTRDMERNALLPVTLRNAATPGALIEPAYGEHVWDFETYTTKLTDLFTTGGLRRAVLHAESGAGKTMLALLLTVGLSAREDQLIPLYLPLATWSPREEEFADWFD
ncbi:hypothetical protein ACFQ9Z_28455, partial [Streptomyces sp. NPDC056580]|uniref:hypothetical protein n=1 Tax=Streptomyces sp. NPDC056580 TaxID=3345872 RepID=UPI003690B6C6